MENFFGILTTVCSIVFVVLVILSIWIGFNPIILKLILTDVIIGYISYKIYENY